MLQIKPINIQACLKATHDAALCCKQIAIPLAQWITLWCPPLPANFLKRELPQPSSLSRVTLHSVGCLHMTSLLWDSGSCRPQTQVYKPLFQSISWLFPLMNSTCPYTMKALCVFSVWSIWAFINSAKHRHLEFLLLIPSYGEKNHFLPSSCILARHQNHVFANNLYSTLSLCPVTAHAHRKS